MRRSVKVTIKEHICHDCKGAGEVPGGDEWVGPVLHPCTTCLGEGMIKSFGKHVPFLLEDPLDLERLDKLELIEF